ncbi:TipAS antibiotic-recognition domain-containing protein [Thalassotalea maritima]|uniref:TipAS antibiotic-recognition domain-containing protein n=1 Tax=Thalassotalea maritima TaxID=3242416 RepID=UPI0035279B29
MTTENEFQENPELEKQEQLARERVGDDKVDERMEQLANMSMEDTMALKEKADAVMMKISTCKNLAADSDDMQAIVKEYLFYTNFALSKLQGKSIVVDYQRFINMAESIANDNDQKAAFDQHGIGTAEHFANAIQIYAEANLK